jgi:hypothetical protein
MEWAPEHAIIIEVRDFVPVLKQSKGKYCYFPRSLSMYFWKYLSVGSSEACILCA